jgi:hypothetical protein
MQRRTWLQVASAFAAARLSPAQTLPQTMQKKPQILELRTYSLRNTTYNMAGELTEFLKSVQMPALKTSGAIATAAFRSSLAPGSPFLMTLASFDGLAGYEAAQTKMGANAEFQSRLKSFDYSGRLPYLRQEVSLLRGFPTFPAIEVPAAAAAPRVYELRRYESNTPSSLARKIRMFDEGEIALFKKVGMTCVFFGETIAGPVMPNLTYLVGYDNMAHRETVWRDFVNSDDWKKMLAQPCVSDGEIVSNISASFLSPLPFSEVR